MLTAATRTGTNELHGSLYEFLRNDKLNANSWTSNRQGLNKTPFRRNEYGFSVGGRCCCRASTTAATALSFS